MPILADAFQKERECGHASMPSLLKALQVYAFERRDKRHPKYCVKQVSSQMRNTQHSKHAFERTEICDGHSRQRTEI
eukprot:3302209-Amphidinium_carterae.1